MIHNQLLALIKELILLEEHPDPFYISLRLALILQEDGYVLPFGLEEEIRAKNEKSILALLK